MLQIKSEEKLAEELDIVKLVKTMRTMSIIKKIVLQKQHRVLLNFNKKGYIGVEDEIEK